MNLAFVIIVLLHVIQGTLSFNLGVFGSFRTTTSPVTSDPTRCRGEPRKWGFCTGTTNPTRTTTDPCRPKLTERCSTGTLLASHFIASALSPSSPSGASRCRRFTHEHEYVEEYHETNRFVKALKRVRRNSTVFSLEAQSPIFHQLRPVTNVILGGCTRRKRQITYTTAIKRDIAIVMDESGSIGSANFGRMKRIASAFVKLLCGEQELSHSRTRVAVTSFNAETHHHKNLIHENINHRLNNDASHMAGFIDFVVNYDSSTDHNTCLVETLDFVKDTVLNSNGARRGEPNVIQEIFLLTDGCEYCGSPKKSIAAVADRLKSVGIDVYVIGVALRDVCQDELDVLIDGGKCFHFFNIVDWMTDLDDFIYQMENPPTLSNGEKFCLPQLYTGSNNCANPSG